MIASAKCWIAGYIPWGSLVVCAVGAGLDTREFWRPVFFEFLVGFVLREEPRRFEAPSDAVAVVDIFPCTTRLLATEEGFLALVEEDWVV